MTSEQPNGPPDDASPPTDPATSTDASKPTDAWVTGDEPMTGAQRSYLKTLSEEAKEAFDDTLTKADASKRIDELQEKTGRGAHAGQH